MVAFASQFQPRPVEAPSRVSLELAEQASRARLRARIRVLETSEGLEIRVKGSFRLAGNRVGRSGFATEKTRWEIRLVVEKTAGEGQLSTN